MFRINVWNPKADIYAAYNLKLNSLLPLYQRLNKPVEYPDGMRTSLGIIY